MNITALSYTTAKDDACEIIISILTYLEFGKKVKLMFDLKICNSA